MSARLGRPQPRRAPSSSEAVPIAIVPSSWPSRGCRWNARASGSPPSLPALRASVAEMRAQAEEVKALRACRRAGRHRAARDLVAAGNHRAEACPARASRLARRQARAARRRRRLGLDALVEWLRTRSRPTASPSPKREWRPWPPSGACAAIRARRSLTMRHATRHEARRLAGTAAYGAFLVGNAAGLVAGLARRRSRGQVSLANAAGTLWNGSAARRCRAARHGVHHRGGPLALPALAPCRRPHRLRDRGARKRLEAAGGRAQAAAHGACMTCGRAATPERLAALPLASAWQPAGAIAIEAAHRLGRTARAARRRAGVARCGPRALRRARRQLSRAQADAEGAAGQGDARDHQGPLRLAGNGTLPLPGRFTFAGEARAEPGRERELEPLLDLLGPRRADGARTLAVR